MPRMHVSGTAGVTTYRVWITMQMDGEDGAVRTDNGWMDGEDGFFVRTGNRWVDGEDWGVDGWWMLKMHLCEDG